MAMNDAAEKPSKLRIYRNVATAQHLIIKITEEEQHRNEKKKTIKYQKKWT